MIIFLYLIKPFQNTQKQNDWVEFDEQILNLEVSNNKVLLLDLTADWCITCQINKQTTLENEGLIEFDTRLLRNFYLNKGFYNVNINSSFAKLLQNNEFELIFNIDAGNKINFGSLDRKSTRLNSSH